MIMTLPIFAIEKELYDGGKNLKMRSGKDKI